MTIELLSGTWNGTSGTLGLSPNGGTLTFHSEDLAYIQISHNNNNGIRLIVEGVTVTTLVLNRSWNGTIPLGEDCYIHWTYPLVLPHEENFMLYVGLFGLALLVSGLLLGAYSFTQYPIFSFKRETIWETSLLMYSIAAAIIGAGLVMTWLLS